MPIDPHSPTWMAVKEWVEQRMAEHARELRAGGHSDDKHRGAMDELDELMKIAEPQSRPKFSPRALLPDRS